MKTITIYIPILLMLLSACNREEKLPTVKGAPLELEITAEDLLPADKAQTRITEGGTGGYTTSFANGDQIGITVLKGGNIVDGMNNVLFTYNQSTGKWTAASGKNLFFYDDAEYIAYYPHSADMNGKKTIDEIVAAFTPKEDQSNYDTGYSPSCLMTATGTANATTKKLQLAFAHKMAMLELQFKQTLNGVEAAVMADAGSTLTVTSGGKNYTFNAQNTDKRYRLMLIPGITVDLKLNYTVGETDYAYTETGIAMPAAGKYLHYDLKCTQTNVTLNTGSYTGALGDIARVVIDGNSCKAVKQNNNTYKIIIPSNNLPVAINKMELYINDNQQNKEVRLLTTTNAALSDSNSKITVSLGAGGMEGVGSQSNPYQVTTPVQLRGVGISNSGKYYSQMNDINISEYTADWRSVGNGTLYDGNHKKVTNLNSTHGGIFTGGGTIQNVHLASGNITVVGLKVGGISNGNATKISNCSNGASITATATNGEIGGILGYGTAIIEHCKNTGAISSERNAGGIAGYTAGATIRYCYNTGTITGNNTDVDVCGGVCSTLGTNGTMEYCYNAGEIKRATVVKMGSVIGRIGFLSKSTCKNCWGTITDSNVSLIADNQNSSTVTNVNQFDSANGKWPVYSSGNGDGWTSDHWKSFGNGDYPQLYWE